MKLRFIGLAALALLWTGVARGQVFQQGGVIPQHFSMWAASNALQDAGGAARLPQGLQPTELGIVAPPNASGSPFPATASGTGPNGENSCLYDSPLGLAGHYLCFSPNVGSNLAAITVGTLSGGPAGGLEFIVNGTKIPFPGAGSGTVVGPGTTAVGNVSCWNNILGTILSDCGPGGALSPLAPTPATNDNSTKVATTAYVQNQGYLTNQTLLPAPQGRLTLVSHTPVMTTSVSNTSTIFYDPFIGNTVPVFNGTNDILLPIPNNEIILTLTSLEEAANFVFDIFGINNGGALTLCTPTNGGGPSGEGWAGDTGGSNTSRGSGYSLISNAPRGYITNVNSITHCFGGGNGTVDFGPIASNKATYLGTYYTSAAGQTTVFFGGASSGGIAANILIWNYYNRVPVATQVTDNGAPYTYTSASFRQARASSGNQISLVSGLGEDPISGTYGITANCGVTGGTFGLGIGVNTTGPLNQAGLEYNCLTNNVGTTQPITTILARGVLGFITFFAVEQADGTHAQNFDATSSNQLLISGRF